MPYKNLNFLFHLFDIFFLQHFVNIPLIKFKKSNAYKGADTDDFLRLQKLRKLKFWKLVFLKKNYATF